MCHAWGCFQSPSRWARMESPPKPRFAQAPSSEQTASGLAAWAWLRLGGRLPSINLPGHPSPSQRSPPVSHLMETISGELPGDVFCGPWSFWWFLSGTSPKPSSSVVAQ